MIVQNKIYLALLLIVLVGVIGCNQPVSQENSKTASFKVLGNCEMCKKTIESSLIQGVDVISRSWNKDSKMMTVTFDSTQIELLEIHKKIAESGYDTDLENGLDEVYQDLPECCKYTRKE